MLEDFIKSRATVVGFNLALERLAVTTTDPLFSAMDVSDVTKVTTGFSSSLILRSKEVFVPNSTLPGLAIETFIVSIGSSLVSWRPVNVTVALWEPAGIVKS